MTRAIDDTRTKSTLDVVAGTPDDAAALAPVPRLQLLYHVDLARIGGFSHPDLALDGGQWQTIGRKRPLFITPTPGDVWRPLADPTVSREQLRVRWLDDVACFEVEPVAGARRKLLIVDPRGAGEPVELRQRARLGPGCCVAVEDRLLVGLELVARFHGPEEERLGLVGESQAMWRLREEIHELCEFRKPVLILGQTGVGKELVAGAIHRHGPDAHGPFQTLNCAALPEQLVESLLFGHTKGSFTGATTNQTGVFEAAHGGTLLLDELGEMPLLVQPKLLRALQDGTITPLGRQQGIKVDVRLLAATNREPELEVAAGRLRADLYHRIAAHVVRLPSLGERRFDVPALLMCFLGRCREDHPGLAWLWQDATRWRATIPMAFFVDLLRGEWPGNVRQLENVAEGVARENLRGRPFSSPALPHSAAQHARSAPAPVAPLVRPEQPVAAADREHEARVRMASQRLGIAPRTIAKLVEPDALAELWRASQSGTGDEAALTARLEQHVHAALHARLSEQDFAQGRVAKALGMSAWTLIRLMQRFEIARPTELSLAQIQRALAAAGGDIARAAASLEVSEHGLKKRLAALDEPH